jgi:hypothetical protein
MGVFHRLLTTAASMALFKRATNAYAFLIGRHVID